MASRAISIQLDHVPGSDLLQYLRGLEQISPDVCRPVIIPFRTTALVGGGTQWAEVPISSDYDFVCDGMMGHVESHATDTRMPSQWIMFNFREGGRGFDMFPDPIPMSLLTTSIGGTGGAGLVMPTVSHQGSICREFRVPYVFAGNSRIRCTWTADALLATIPGPLLRVVDMALVGYLVRAGMVVVSKSATSVKK